MCNCTHYCCHSGFYDIARVEGLGLAGGKPHSQARVKIAISAGQIYSDESDRRTRREIQPFLCVYKCVCVCFLVLVC